jgi:hypothetical protein
MQSNAEVIDFPSRTSHEDDGPRFIAWRYDRGELSIHVEGFDEHADGEMLLSFSPEVGVEIGEPTVLALSGEPSLLLFRGKFEDHRDFFRNEWGRLAEENERPAIFNEQGLAGLARLPMLPEPPLPEIDEAQAAHANAVLQEARDRVAEIGAEQNLTLDDCYGILAQVETEMKASERKRKEQEKR